MKGNQEEGLVWHEDQQPRALYPTMPDPDGVYPYRCTGCNGIVYEGKCNYCATHPQNTSWRSSGVDDHGKHRGDYNFYGRRRYRR